MSIAALTAPLIGQGEVDVSPGIGSLEVLNVVCGFQDDEGAVCFLSEFPGFIFGIERQDELLLKVLGNGFGKGQFGRIWPVVDVLHDLGSPCTKKASSVIGTGFKIVDLGKS